jgi:flagellar L-ring protein precursor FlgH
VDVAEVTYARPEAVVEPVVSNGAIFQATQYRPLFEDHRARLIGDSLTVQIVEKVSASQKSTSSIDKGGKVTAAITALPGLSANSFARASAAGSSSNTFEGKGSTENTNDFSGTITATVTGVLPNGHLLIAGEKQIGVNHNVDVLRFLRAGRSARDPVRQRRRLGADRERADRAPRPWRAGRRTGNRLARTVLFERSSDLSLPRMG